MKALLFLAMLVVMLSGCASAPATSPATPSFTSPMLDYATAKSMIENGVDVNIKSSNGGNTALHWAAGLKHLEVLSLLIKKGADVNAQNENGATPLHFAASAGNTEIVKILLKNGAKVNSKTTEEGLTPLFAAIAKGQNETARFLIAKGGIAPMRNRDGRTAEEQWLFKADAMKQVQQAEQSNNGKPGFADSLLGSVTNQATGKLREQGSQMGGAGKVFAHTEADLLDKTTEQTIQQSRESRQQAQQMQATGNQGTTGRYGNAATVTKVASSAGAKNTRPPNSRRIYGVVASGWPWSNAKVSVKASGDDLGDLNEHIDSAISDAEGGFFIDIVGLTKKVNSFELLAK